MTLRHRAGSARPMNAPVNRGPSRPSEACRRRPVFRLIAPDNVTLTATVGRHQSAMKVRAPLDRRVRRRINLPSVPRWVETSPRGTASCSITVIIAVYYY